MTIQIRKIDVDDLCRADGPPTWGRIKAVVNGVEVILSLNEERITRLLDFVTPLAMEMVDQIINAPNVVVELKRPREPAA